MEVDLGLEDLAVHADLGRRGKTEKQALAFAGVLHTICHDAAELLEFIRASYPSYTGHNIQHSFRILQCLSQVISIQALHKLSSLELFALVVAAVFHDTGLARTDASAGRDLRLTHAKTSSEIMTDYFTQYYPRISSDGRLLRHIGFIIEAHGMTWKEMISREQFNSHDTIQGQVLRPNILSVLLRVGDLLDIETERSNSSLYWFLRQTLHKDMSRIHHEMTKHIERFSPDNDAIHIVVTSHSREEHQIWSEWFHYLEQDILSANTYVFVGDLASFHLPKPELRINRSELATYDLWPLRFEIDEAGKIWDVISRSIYTNKYDFLRELIQNAIDAELMWIFLNKASAIDHRSPRAWSLPGYAPDVIIQYFRSSKSIAVLDNGIGMERIDLERFLFRVASTGYYEVRTGRDFQFPAIAKFGIGFVAVLTKSAEVVIESRKRTISDSRTNSAHKVTLEANSRDAYVEEVAHLPLGTRIVLRLKDEYRSQPMIKYLQGTFAFTSVPIHFVDMEMLHSTIATARDLNVPISSDLSLLCKATVETPPPIKGMGELLNELATVRRSIREKQLALKVDVSLPTDPVTIVWSSTVETEPSRELYVASLDTRLRIRRVYTRPRISNSVFAGSGVLWIPVNVVDYDVGFEWQSYHAFLYSDHRITNVIYLLAKDSEPDGFSDSDLIVTDEDIEFGRLEDDEQVTDLCEEIRAQRDDFYYRKKQIQQYKAEEAIYLGSERVVRTGMLEDSLATTNPFEKNSFDASEFGSTDKYFTLVDRIGSIRNCTFQDGILIPLKPAEIVPFGACRADVNLTAGARFQLNVSRADIDKSPSLIANWTTDIGSQIRARVFRTLVDTFEKYSLAWDHASVVMDANDYEYLDTELSRASSEAALDEILKRR